jgi:lipoate---protein ligase
LISQPFAAIRQIRNGSYAKQRRNILQTQRSSRQDWQIIPFTIADQQVHITRSEQLLSAAAPGTLPVLYWSQAQPAGLILGFSQKETIINPAALAEEALPIYHRRAGGTAVLVGVDLLGLDVVLPADHPLVETDIVESYRWFGETWVRALHQLGIATRVVTPAEAHAQRDLARADEVREREAVLRRACYASNSSYEVVVGQRKVVGLDMIRRRNGSLLQAGILLSWQSERLAHLLGHTAAEQNVLRRELPGRAVGLDELAQHPISVQQIIQVFEASLMDI